jgi:hypothetical protein
MARFVDAALLRSAPSSEAATREPSELLRALLAYWNETEEYFLSHEKPEAIKTAWRGVLAAGCGEAPTAAGGALADILCRAYYYDDKPHQLFTAIARAAKGHEDEGGIVRLMMEATEKPAPGRQTHIRESEARVIFEAGRQAQRDYISSGEEDPEAAFQRALASLTQEGK